MRRLAFNSLRVLSLLLCLAMITLWIRSRSIRPEHVHFLLYDDARRAERELDVWGFRGGVLLCFGESRYTDVTAEHWARVTGRANAEGGPSPTAWIPSVNWYRDAPYPSPKHINWFGFEHWPHDEPDADGRVAFIGRHWILRAPYWPLVLVTALAPAAWLVRHRRRRRRAWRGQCVHCGYDLRASSGVCPECGKQAE